MVKYLSGRQKLRPSDKLTEDRYQYLGLDQAEPNLADPATSPRLARRKLLKVLAGAGIGTSCFHRALAAQASQTGQVSAAMIKEAAWIAGLELSPDDQESTAQRLRRTLNSFQSLRSLPLGYDVPPALYFSASPVPASSARKPDRQVKSSQQPKLKRPQDDRDLAFLPVFRLAELVRTGQVTSMELTELYFYNNNSDIN